MLWIQIIVQWLHVFFATAWFGATFFMFAIGMPALRNVDPSAATSVGMQLGMRLTRLLGMAGGLTILFGLINAIAFGPVRSLSFVFGTAYGITFLIAVILAGVIASMGGQTGRIGMSIAAAPDADRPKLLAGIDRLTKLSVAGFVVVLACMVLMRFGL